jgi:glycerol-3-phosphate dehydrogenase
VVAAAAAQGVDAATAEHLARNYGEDAEAVLALARSGDGLGERIVAGHPYLWAEVPHAVRAEMAVTLRDVLARRLQLFYHAADGGLSVAEAVARRMAAEPGIGWDDDAVPREVAAYRREVERTRGFR